MAEPERPLPVSPGDVVDDRYRIERVLGRGGMGVVYAAEHLLLKSRVAIKFMLQTESAESVARFAREAQIAAGLISLHSVRVTDVVTPAGRPPYLVMELLSGRDLGALLTERGPLPLEEAVGYVLQACDAIAEAHASGVVHRDVKPANLFLARQPDGSSIVKVLDFGLSKLVEVAEGAPSLSTRSAVMGSPCYMSPEQLRSAKRVDARTDVWAMGVVLYELVTGKLPFDFESFSELLVAISTDPPVPASLRVRGLPAALDGVFERCFQKKPRDRYASILEFAHAITPFARPEDRGRVSAIERRTTGPVSDISHADTFIAPSNPAIGFHSTAMAPQQPITLSVNGEKRRGGAAAVGAGVGVALAIAGIAVFMNSRQGGTVTPASPDVARATSIAPALPSAPAVPLPASAVPTPIAAPSSSALPASSSSANSLKEVRGPRIKPSPRLPAPVHSAALPSGVLVDEP